MQCWLLGEGAVKLWELVWRSHASGWCCCWKPQCTEATTVVRSVMSCDFCSTGKPCFLLHYNPFQPETTEREQLSFILSAEIRIRIAGVPGISDPVAHVCTEKKITKAPPHRSWVSSWNQADTVVGGECWSLISYSDQLMIAKHSLLNTATGNGQRQSNCGF